MAVPRCSRLLATMPEHTMHKSRAAYATLDRYSLIRSFFQNRQTVATSFSTSYLQSRHYATKRTRSILDSTNCAFCTQRAWLHVQLHSVSRGTNLAHNEAPYGNTRLWARLTPSMFMVPNAHMKLGGKHWIHTSTILWQAKPPDTGQRSKQDDDHSSLKENSYTSPNVSQNHDTPVVETPPQHQSLDPTNPPKHLEDYSRFFQRLALSLPYPHRPTRDDFLRVATSFWQRLRIRFKWFTIKSFRKFNADDISAFVTWFLMSQTIWILIGTTTFFSVIFAIANSLKLQHYIARALSDHLTSETGVTIIFESAIVPKWRESRISFKNVYVSRRPPESPTRTANPRRNEHLTAVGYDIANHPGYHRFGDDEDETTVQVPLDEQDTNMSLFDLTIDSVDVTLSLWRWLDGKGLVQDAVIRGVRGVLDRRNVFWDPDNPPDPALFRHKSAPGDFELESLQLEDVLITVYQPGGFRPYTTSIFRADMQQFRKRWLFYDFLCAENVVGQFDNCLFSLHRPQSIGRTTEKDLEDGEWARMSRIRIDGVKVDHLQNSTTMEGPISWITSGKVDAVLDIKFPRDPHDDLPLNVILGEIADAISTSFSGTFPDAEQNNPELKRIPGQRELARPPLTAPPVEMSEDEERWGRAEESLKVVIDIDLRFRDLKAAVPIFTNDLSYVNNAFIRPIVAFMNANRTLVPIHCKLVKDLSDFDGAWTMWETGLMDDISIKTYDALAYHVSQASMNRQRMKTVSLWSLQMTANAILNALKNIADPMSVHLKTYLTTKRQEMGLQLYDVSSPLGVHMDVQKFTI